MKAVSEYRQHAAECRKLACPKGTRANSFLTMAETWERLARDRESRLPLQPDEAPKAPPKK
jgi:hypothetical protein